LIDKATLLAGVLLEMSGKKNGKDLAAEALKSGNAERKLREIIAAQGGRPDITPEDIVVGDQQFTACSSKSGFVLWIDNNSVVEISRLAGAPKDKGAGVLLHKKIGDKVEKDEPLFTIYAEINAKLQRALDELERIMVMGVGERMDMLIHEVKERPVPKKAFMLER